MALGLVHFLAKELVVSVFLCLLQCYMAFIRIHIHIHTPINQTPKQEPTPPAPAASDSLTNNHDGTLGGGQIQDFPTATRRARRALRSGLWRARAAVEGLLHVSLSFGWWCCCWWVVSTMSRTKTPLLTGASLSHLSHQNTKQVALQYRQGGGVAAPVPQRVCALLRASLAGVERQVGTTVLVGKSLCLYVCSHPSITFPVRRFSGWGRQQRR